MAHDYTRQWVGESWIVRVSPSTEYGYFEHREYGTNGGLWFDGIELIDYDGVTQLPQEVISALAGAGFDVRYVLDEDDERQPDEAQEWYDFDPDC